jgi:predicted transcriptional regulator
MEIRFKPELGAKLAESGALQGRNPEELVEEVVSHYFDEESQLIEAVTRGEGALQRAEYLTHEEVGERLGARWSLPGAEDLGQICERSERDDPEAAGALPESSELRPKHIGPKEGDKFQMSSGELRGDTWHADRVRP